MPSRQRLIKCACQFVNRPRRSKVLEVIEIPAEEIKAGDQFTDGGRLHWTALADAEPSTAYGVDTVIVVKIRWRDGGESVRAWDPGVTLPITREEVTA